jgi:predicted SAM-dependent methyltransferase
MTPTWRNCVRSITPPWARPAGRSVERLVIRAARTIFPPSLPVNGNGRVLLNLGCGSVTHTSFINVDALAGWHVHYIRRIDKLRFIADGYADLVYASHCLEHFSHRQVNAVLTEWYRVLKPGGILRLGVPDFDQLVAVYEASGRDLERIQGVLMGGQDYPRNAHNCSFNRKSLTDRLTAVGFNTVREWKRGTDELTNLPDYTGLTFLVGERVYAVSLNLEAVK